MASLKHDIIGSTLVLKPSRRLDSSSAKAFEDDAAALVGKGPQKVVIDASELDFLSSAGLRVILTTAKKAKVAGGGLTIARAKDNVREVLVVSGFDQIFGLHECISEAMAALT